MRNLTVFTTVALLAASKVAAHGSVTKCAKGLKMFVSRGTGEPEGLGATESLVKTIAERISESDYEAIEYPASANNPSYFASVGNGTMLVREALEDYAEACPGSKMAFFGYSQGGQITTNLFCGMPVVWGTSLGFDTTSELDEIIEFSQPLASEMTKNVVSVVLFGDPSHRSDASYNYGNSTGGNGIFWRSDISSCENLGGRIRSYCNAGDPFCDVGKTVDVEVHGKYLANYGEEVAQYVVKQYQSSFQ